MRTDGTTEQKIYETPTSPYNYFKSAGGAVLKGVFYIFGGSKGANEYNKARKIFFQWNRHKL